MTNITEAELLLENWGRWNRGYQSLGISKHIIGRVMDEGAGASHSTVKTEPHMSPAVEITELCVLQMDKPLQRVCKFKYIGQWSDRDAAKRLKLTLDIYEIRVNQAVLVVAEFVKIN